MVLEGEERSLCKVFVDWMQLEHVLFNESDTKLQMEANVLEK